MLVLRIPAPGLLLSYCSSFSVRYYVQDIHCGSCGIDWLFIGQRHLCLSKWHRNWVRYSSVWIYSVSCKCCCCWRQHPSARWHLQGTSSIRLRQSWTNSRSQQQTSRSPRVDQGLRRSPSALMRRKKSFLTAKVCQALRMDSTSHCRTRSAVSCISRRAITGCSTTSN